jgi:hypothetical protein
MAGVTSGSSNEIDDECVLRKFEIGIIGWNS